TDRDEAILRMIRDATDKPLRVDANAGWTRERALQMLPVLREYGVEFVEQPLSPEDLEGLAALQRRGILPIVVDESCIVATDIPRLAGGVDGINIKLAKCGSLREALSMTATARVPVCSPCALPLRGHAAVRLTPGVRRASPVEGRGAVASGAPPPPPPPRPAPPGAVARAPPHEPRARRAAGGGDRGGGGCGAARL